MLLNRLPCLDKGYVALIDSSNNGNKLKDVAMEFFRSTNIGALHDISTLTLAIKCPLFVQLNLSLHDFYIKAAQQSDVIEAYVPNVGEIGAPNHETCKAISEDIHATTEALLINPKAYQADGCNKFTSQVMTPISAYTTLIVHGSYNEWRRFCNQKNMPTSLHHYTDAVNQILVMEWK